ncbi:unnamed protein product [Arabis nemorensis]|uniref:Uncharacterized protein n=1 Tax=Arabis nemorensis TaxID=586526 RepID=A0A565CMX6_9BRAS|nr:unnamed protein product [Arabis nemorensis]
MANTITTFDIRLQQPLEKEIGGLIVIKTTIYRNFTTTPSVRTYFFFNLSDFLYEDESEDKEYFYEYLRRERVDNANTILMNIIMLVDNETSSSTYSIMNNVTYHVSLHICDITTNLTEEQAIQESFDAAIVVQRLAFQASIDALERKLFEVEENMHGKKESSCMICL